jgi:hypothetical protein
MAFGGGMKTPKIEFYYAGVKKPKKMPPFSFVKSDSLSLAGLPLFTINPGMLLGDLPSGEMGVMRRAIMEMTERRIRDVEMMRMDLFERRMLSSGPPKGVSREQFVRLIPIAYEINAVCRGDKDRIKHVMDEWEKRAGEGRGRDLVSTLFVILEEEFYITGGEGKIGKGGGVGARVQMEEGLSPTEKIIGVGAEKPSMPGMAAQTIERIELRKLVKNAGRMPNARIVSLREMLRYHLERNPREYQGLIRVLFNLSDEELADPALVQALIAAEIERVGAFGFSDIVYRKLMAKWKKKNKKEKMERFGCVYDPISGQFIICSLCATLKGVASMLLEKLKSR